MKNLLYLGMCTFNTREANPTVNGAAGVPDSFQLAVGTGTAVAGAAGMGENDCPNNFITLANTLVRTVPAIAVVGAPTTVQLLPRYWCVSSPPFYFMF